MSDAKLLKIISTEILPGSLYKQLDPHLDKICSACEEAEWINAELDFRESEDDRKRLNQIRAEFDKANAANWPSYARARWPEIDKYFILDNSTEQDGLPWS